MTEISHVDVESIEWSVSPPKPGMPSDNPGVRSRLIFDLPDDEVTAMLCEYEPGHWEPEHAHRRNEVLVVLDGSAAAAGVELKKGSAIFVPAGTGYGPLTGGPRGMRFVRFEFPERA